MTLTVLVYAVYAISRYETYLVAGYDLGIFDQVVRSYAHFEAPIVTLKGDGYNIWGDHFHPIIALWAPLYWLWDDPRMLLVGQVLVVAVAVIPVHRFLLRHMRARWANLMAAAIILGWPIEDLIDFDVHEIAFAVPLLAWAIDALDTRRYRQLIAACGLLLLVREDMGAVVAMAGLVCAGSAWWRARARRRAGEEPVVDRGVLVGLGLVVAGAAVFVLVTMVVIPHFSTGGFDYWDYSQLGDGVSGAIVGALTQPWKVVALLFWPGMKTLTWLLLLVPLLFLPLRSPLALLALPIMAERMLADRENLWTFHFHYNAPVWIILALAAVDGAALLARSERLHARFERMKTLELQRLLALWAAFTVLIGWVLGIGGYLISGSRTITDIYPLPRLITGEAFRMTSEQHDRAAIVAYLPADTCVVADDRIAGQLTRSNRVTVPGVSQHRQDFYVLDFSEPYPATTPADWTTEEASAHATDAGFHEVFRSGDIVVYQSPDYAGPSPQCSPVES
jgi:uncharacterized membrane protein